jgi:hypothetical protein
VKQDQIVFLALGVSILFGFIANTKAHSFTGVELFSSIIIFKLLGQSRIVSKCNSKACACACMAVTLLIVAHQVLIIKEIKCVNTATQKAIAESANSKYGVAKVPEFDFSCLTRPYVNNWFELEGFPFSYMCKSISLYYLNNKPFYALNENDYNALHNPSKFFVEQNKIAGDAQAYRGEKFCWLKAENVPQSKKLKFEYYPMRSEDCTTWTMALKFKLKPASYPDSEIFELPDSLEIKNDDGLVMLQWPRDFRRVKSISLAE